VLPYEEWLDSAQALPLGVSKRVKHCNHNTTMKISHDEDGYHAYCFRCSEGGFKKHGIQRIRDVFAEKEFCYAKDVRLPSDYTLDVPSTAAVWYYSVGISARTAREYGIGFSRNLDRVILPVYHDGSLAVVQARAVRPGMQPKYLNQAGNNKASVLFKSHNTEGDTVCVTEDILSCIRVGEVIPCVSCMGTSMSDAQAAALMRYKNVIIWLDNDEAGHKGALRMHKKLRGVMNSCILTAQHDPKCYDREHISELLRGSVVHDL
jgi:hypothetical protein